MKRISVTLAGLSIALAGCAIGPDYERPVTGAPHVYRHAETADAFVDHDGAWWLGFGDPVLASLVEEAMRSNYDARIAAARIEQFSGQVQATRAGLFPSVGASSAANREKRSLFAGTPLEGFDGPNDRFQVQGGVNWEIDLWGRIRRQTEAAKADLWAAEYARRGIALSLAASVAQGYFTLRGLDAQLEIAQRTLDARGHALDIFTLRRAHGVISDMELSQAQDDYFATQAAIPPLRANIVRIENALSVLLGREPGPIERGRAVSLMTLPPLAADPPINLLNRRPDLLRAEQGAVAANALFGAAQTLHLPSLSLSGFIGQAAGGTGALWHGASQIWGISAGLSQPIFQGGAIRGQVRIAGSQREQALLAYQGAVLKAIAEVDDALVGAQQSAVRLGSLNSQKDALAVYANQASARYEGGYSSFLEVTNAQEKLFNAQLADVQGRVDLLSAYVALYKALGGGWASVPRDVRQAGEMSVMPPETNAAGKRG
ncbi:efflux transporter outer membrane subunit [Burkholderia ubonensis]|uniref:Multidrug transporter n=1 Tax=Burkholderia ubonensis TaxID=101571 RepID=A0A1R1JIU8_9BURK|nr:efflux transporter outer membrane subunit [Burkholderia ubonensis]OMG75200.1 multidrug transporter [Burkholderia ubonensis]